MKAKALRLPDPLLHGVAWVSGRERSDWSETLRRLVWLGLERDLAERYRRGELSLREAARILQRPLRDILETFWQLGVSGNIAAAQALRTLDDVGDSDRGPQRARAFGAIRKPPRKR